MRSISSVLSCGFLFLTCLTTACAGVGGPVASAPGAGARPVVIVRQVSGVAASLRGVAVWDDRSVWASGTNGTVLKSTDGGTSWEHLQISGAESLDFRDIELLDADTVLLMSVGNGGDSRVYKTSDAGATWRAVYVNTEEQAFFNGFAFWNESSGVLTSDGFDGRLFLLMTEDGAESWRRVGAESLPALLEGELGFAASGSGIAVAGESRLWVATGGVAARVFHSPDAGASWEVYTTPIGSGTQSSGIFSIAFRDERHGVAVGGDYQDPDVDRVNVARTTDGARSWNAADSAGGMPQKACVRYLGDGRYLAAGRTGVAYSEDDGRTWRHLSADAYYAIGYHQPTGVGWLVGPEGAVARFEVGKAAARPPDLR